jgi:hypothetical protein
VPAIKFIGMPEEDVAGTLELINGFVKAVFLSHPLCHN